MSNQDVGWDLPPPAPPAPAPPAPTGPGLVAGQGAPAAHGRTRLDLVAGHLGGRGNADGIGADARFAKPQGGALDDAGNLYLADTLNGAIRRVSPTSEVTTLVGQAYAAALYATGTAMGRDGTLGEAILAAPTDVAYGWGVLYVMDVGALRRVDLERAVVTTVAGSLTELGSADGVGSSARFSAVGDIALVKDVVYVADTQNSTIRRIDLATANVTTLAGAAGQMGTKEGVGAEARFNYPYGLSVDASGNLWVADQQFLYTVDTQTGRVAFANRNIPFPKDVVFGQAWEESITVLGYGGLYSPIGQPAVATPFFTTPLTAITADSQGRIYASAADDTVHSGDPYRGPSSFPALAGTPEDVGGTVDGVGATAQFTYPAAVVADGAGHAYVADLADNVIRAIDLATNTVTTLAGAARVAATTDGDVAHARFQHPSALALDGSGTLFVADKSTIRKIVLATGEVSTIAAALPDASGLAVDRTGHLFVCDGDGRLRRIDLSSGEETTLADRGFASIATDEQGALFGAQGPRIARLDPHTGAPLGTLAQIGDSPYSRASALALDGHGHIYAADAEAHTVCEVTLATGAVAVHIGKPLTKGVKTGPLPGGLSAPSGLAVAGDGSLLLVDPGEHAILAAR